MSDNIWMKHETEALGIKLARFKPFSISPCTVAFLFRLFAGQRAKAMKFVDGLMIHSGEPSREYVDTAVRHVLLRQGKSYLIVCR